MTYCVSISFAITILSSFYSTTYPSALFSLQISLININPFSVYSRDRVSLGPCPRARRPPWQPPWPPPLAGPAVLPGYATRPRGWVLISGGSTAAPRSGYPLVPLRSSPVPIAKLLGYLQSGVLFHFCSCPPNTFWFHLSTNKLCKDLHYG